MNRNTLLEALGVAGALVATIVGQAVLWGWVVEDAAISFAYARNLAEGWGLVRFPGDERVEGYSNPLWVLLMAAAHRIGFDGFQSSKGMALALSAVAIPAVWAIGRQAALPAVGAVLAAWLLALDAQYVIWSASGLENGLFCTLLALGIWRTVADEERGGFPYAALCWLGLALTRPEGVGYAAIGGAWALLLEATGKRRWTRIVAWLAVFWLPFAAYHAVRYDWFAYAFPATYYAKIGDAEAQPFAWNARSWTYLRDWSAETGRTWFLPVLLAGVVGLRGWRGWAVLAASIWLGAFLLYPGVEPFVGWGWIPAKLKLPDWWVGVRVSSLALVALAAPLLGAGQPGWRARGLLWSLGAFAVFFSVYSSGDWMRGYRWMSLAAVPGALLLAAGCVEVAQAVGRFGAHRAWAVGGGVLGAALAVGAIVPHVFYQARYVPETSPWSVDKRVRHYRWAMQQLQLEHADILDHDMGAMLYWGTDLGIVRDSRGLADIAFALYGRDRNFVREYAWEEYPFDLAHGHASTQYAVRTQGREWTQDYVEFPGYGGAGLHTGNYVRRSLLVGPDWSTGLERAARFADRVVLHGLDVPAPEVAPGSWLYVEFGLSTRPRPTEPIRVLFALIAEDGTARAFDVPLGFDDWLPVTEWRAGEIFQGRVSFPIPPDLPLGRYDFGVVVLGPDGVLAAESVGEGGRIGDPVAFARGEVVFPGIVEIVDKERMAREAKADVSRAFDAASKLDCAAAERWWSRARAHRIRSTDWKASVRPGIADALAICWSLSAERAPRAEGVAQMRRALAWNRLHPTVHRAGSALGASLHAEGLALRAEGDLDGAYAAFRDAVFVDPSRAWSRRYAEELRAERLGLRRRR